VTITVEESLAFSTTQEGSGLSRSGNIWRSKEGGAAAVTRVEANAASFTLDPEEGC
jgi:hypothetical protein